MPTAPFALLDNARDGRARYFGDHRRRDSISAADIGRLDACLLHGLEAGLHPVLRIPYDFGRDLMGLGDRRARLHIDWYADCRRWQAADIEDFFARQTPQPCGRLSRLRWQHGTADFAAAIAAIHDAIRAGDVYQINHTDTLLADFDGDPLTLYRHLRRRQPAPYAALLYHPDDGHTLCLSPELFLRLEAGTISSEPMKGTAPNPGGEGEAAAAAALAADEKNRAENAMIIDLLRNDLGKIARIGSVEVRRPFHVEAFGSVLQMTGEVLAVLRPDTTLADILRATFPGGSITGAPKHMAVQRIHQLEHRRPRGLYTGSIATVERASDGWRARFNIVIRSLEIRDRHARLGVGCGITIDSDPAAEIAELEHKTAFIRPALLDTLRVENGRPLRLAAHRRRLEKSAQALEIAIDPDAWEENIRRLAAQIHGSGGLRSELRHRRPADIRPIPLTPNPHTALLRLAPQRLSERDPLRRHKTDRRLVYDDGLAAATAAGAFDTLYLNRRGEVLEGARSNLFLRLDGKWHTPGAELDILCGVMREEILARPALIGAVSICESRITEEMLQRAEALIVCNSLRGILPARLLCSE